MIDRERVDRWLDAYVDAWKSYDREAIAALFAERVEYRYHPHDEPIRGRDAVVASWLGEGDDPAASTRDEPGTYDASYERSPSTATSRSRSASAPTPGPRRPTTTAT